MMKKRLGFIVSVALALVFVFITVMPAQAVTLKFNTWSISTQSWGAANNGYLDKIQQRTNNQVTFQRFWLGSLIPARKEVDGIGKGVGDIASIYSPFARSRLSLIDVGMLPATAESLDTFGADLVKLYHKVPAIEEQFAKWNLHCVAILGGDPAYIISRTPIKTLDDLKGKKIRVLGAGARVLKKLGAVPVGLASAECYEALERGTIDAVVMPSVGITMWKLHEAGKYLTHLPVYCNEFYFMMNKDKWESLSADIQKVFNEVAEETPADWVQYRLEDYEKIYNEYYPKAGVEVIEIAPEELQKYRKAARGEWDTWAKKQDKAGLPGTQVLNEWLKIRGLR